MGKTQRHLEVLSMAAVVVDINTTILTPETTADVAAGAQQTKAEQAWEDL
jgi:hypothetical protein